METYTLRPVAFHPAKTRGLRRPWYAPSRYTSIDTPADVPARAVQIDPPSRLFSGCSLTVVVGVKSDDDVHF